MYAAFSFLERGVGHCPRDKSRKDTQKAEMGHFPAENSTMCRHVWGISLLRADWYIVSRTAAHLAFCHFPDESMPAVTSGAVRIDDNFFAEYLTNSCSAVQHDEDDEAHSGMTKTARDFLKKKFGTISRFYSNITTADTADVNGFSRINALRKALAALDRGGWERSYHQRIFHVSACSFFRLLLCAMPSHQNSWFSRPNWPFKYMVAHTGIVFELGCSGAFQDRSPRILRAILPAALGNEHLAEH